MFSQNMFMKNWKILATSIFFFGLTLGAGGKAVASEGTIEMRSTTTQDNRCFGFSAMLEDNQFHILLTCRNLIYPSTAYNLHYLLWANPKQGDKVIKLGSLGFGKIQAKTRTEFASLFVTNETDKNTRKPTGEVVMKGVVEPVELFTNLVNVSDCEVCRETEEAATQSTDIQEIKPTPETEKVSEAKDLLSRGGSLFVIAGGIIALLFLIYVITKK